MSFFNSIKIPKKTLKFNDFKLKTEKKIPKKHFEIQWLL
jgi:hypothetical protein